MKQSTSMIVLALLAAALAVGGCNGEPEDGGTVADRPPPRAVEPDREMDDEPAPEMDEAPDPAPEMDEPPVEPDEPPSDDPPPPPAEPGQAEEETAMSEPEQRPIETVILHTSMGDITLELNREQAPISVENFLSYARRDFYDGTIFHRVVPGFVIQGGGFTPDMQQKPTDPPIENEWRNGLKNERGTIAMARTAQPNSATSQFFINVADNANLDGPISGDAGYAVFGRVTEGMEVVDEIRQVRTHTVGSHQGVPVDPVIIEDVVVPPADGTDQ